MSGIQGTGTSLCAQQSPAAAEEPLSYQDVLESLAKSAPAYAHDMRDLTLRETAAALAEADEQFIYDALADDPVTFKRQLVSALSKPGQSDTERYTAVGMVVVAALRGYAHELVHEGVLELLDGRSDADRVEGAYEVVR